ncbi:MAG: bifunctional enoyl-CoA hydratase/phosphate acetyltransferase [Bacteroidales bacterium]|nr:bifunctional enoyl-CoA hydratase/phosphate acetyltransferase [Bacteroidales bacterium]MCF8334131.1 bifunctional enoyl-CoA hydratase/phosphate acetyltransferase [Bacteroidales bacterium]
MLKTLSDLVTIAGEKKTRRLAVAAAEDEAVLEAIKDAHEKRIIHPVLVGDKEKIESMCKEIGLSLDNADIVDNKQGASESARIAVSLIKEGKADVLMKGMVSTGPLLKAVLDKEQGLRKGGTLSHVAFFESPYYHKLLGVTDAAMNVAPEFEDKVDMLNNAVEAFHKLGIENPKVAVVGAVETVNTKMEATTHAAIMKTMNARNQIKGCVVDGPLAIDNAISREAAEHKKIHSEVAGDCDIILTPDIEAGNILYKALNFLGGATAAAVIMGAAVPVVLTSRSDNKHSKMLSIALAAAMD